MRGELFAAVVLSCGARMFISEHVAGACTSNADPLHRAAICRIVHYMNMTPTVPETTLGERLRLSRTRAGVSVQQMADELEISRTMISRWENGHERPRRGMLLGWALRCAVPVPWLEHDAGGASADDPFGVLAGSGPGLRRVGDDEQAEVSLRSRWFSLDLRAVAA